MLQIRQHVFETNSSSVHSMVMCSEDEYKQLERGKLLISNWDRELITYEEAVKKAIDEVQNHPTWFEKEDQEFVNHIKDYSESKVIKWLNKNDIAMTLDDYLNEDEYETFEDSYVTKNNDKVYAFGYYGHD